MPEVEQQLLIWMVTGQIVDCDLGLSIVLSHDPESLLDSQLWADCQGDLTACYCTDINLQYDVDVSSSPLHIRLLHLIKAKFALYSTRMSILFVPL